MATMCKTKEDVAKGILNDARAFKKSIHRGCDYQDYERFKQQLLMNDCYGYEKQLADILGV